MRGPNDFKTERARLLRQDSTNVERKLWYRLRSRSINGYKFVRQEPIGPYIVDFICRDKRLIVELDGGQHAMRTVADDRRASFLANRGYLVLRFWNNDVLENMDGVLQVIMEALNDRPSPTPPAGGRGS